MKYTFLILFFTSILSVFGQKIDSVALKTQVSQSIKDLREFVEIPSDALNPDDIDDNIFWLKKQFEKRGFNTAELETENLPLFFATMPMEDGKPTVLLYMHFDGQSVDPSKWDQPNPYQVVLKKPSEEGYETVDFAMLDEKINYDWRLFGRATADDKGPIIMFLNAIDLLQEKGKKLAFNIKVILDGEEEKGSKPIASAVKQYKELLNADFLMISDGPMHSSGLPTLVYGCRGITTMSLTTYGPIKHQHSGHYGNFAPNPGFQLAKLLASMKDEEGRVTIPGYYDGIALSESVTEILKKVPDDDRVIAEKLQFKEAEKVGSFYQEALQYPSLNVRGLGSGWIGDQARTIVPESATAELDLRLVPETDGNRLKKLVRDHIAKQGFQILDHEPTKKERMQYNKIISIKERGVTDAFRTDLDNEYGNFLVNTLSETFGESPIQIRIMGGTVPISPFVNELQIPAFVVPLVNADNNQHSPNENLKIGQLEYGIRAFYNILSSPLK
ncbi:M20/M25/M40 family metallo-hydrolase [Croceivirga thetidis]|uniref:M20/M25/M40 family metallo-hydrolase n=1 Tax=Croceivirga thetidis TaxID=2721623 RepID=A0ABX1GUQ8_9FLAO|nr:M20/M25/M40 family metallo-hydrolase [Croceivirga thetidis]NKI33393.1 M20/M25/M40 family metallo-hydrolase [Croceivirga thetidis]